MSEKTFSKKQFLRNFQELFLSCLKHSKKNFQENLLSCLKKVKKKI